MNFPGRLTLVAITLAAITQLQAQLAAGVSPGPGQTLAIFREAKAAAREAPTPASEHLLANVARQEMLAGNKREATDDFTGLFAHVHAWGTLDASDPLDHLRSTTRGIVEGVAIRTLAQAGDIGQALADASDLDPAPTQEASSVYNWVIEAMVERHRTDRAIEAIHACGMRDGSFPYDGVIALANDRDLPQDFRSSVALDGLQAAGNAQAPIDINTAANFLRHLRAIETDLDPKIEDTGLALLSKVKNSTATDEPPQARAGDAALLVELIGEIDPNRAEELRAEFPGRLPESAPLRIETGSNGKIGLHVGMSPGAQIADQAASDPAGALANAQGLQDAAERFRSLVGIAEATISSNPKTANNAASEAEGGLRNNDDLWVTSLVSAVKLSVVLDRLGDHRTAEDLLERGLNHADSIASDAAERFASLTPAEQAQRFGSLALTNLTLTSVFQSAANVNPTLALRHAREIRSPMLRAGVLAMVASSLASRQAAN